MILVPGNGDWKRVFELLVTNADPFMPDDTEPSLPAYFCVSKCSAEF